MHFIMLLMLVAMYSLFAAAGGACVSWGIRIYRMSRDNSPLRCYVGGFGLIAIGITIGYVLMAQYVYPTLRSTPLLMLVPAAVWLFFASRKIVHSLFAEVSYQRNSRHIA